MKNTALVLVTLFLATILSACATTGSMDDAKVKCPACGYEFNVGAGETGSM